MGWCRKEGLWQFVSLSADIWILLVTSQSDTTTLLGSNRREYYQILQWMSIANSELLPNSKYFAE